MAEQIDRKQMRTLPDAQTHEAFSRIDYWDKPDGSGRVVQVFMKVGDLAEEKMRMGLAIDGSGSMELLFGRKPTSAFLPPPPNHVRPTAQAVSNYLAGKSADGHVPVIYWATGAGGKDIQIIGDLSAAEAEKHPFNRPDSFGSGTQLLPALKYFTDGDQRKDLKDAKLGLYVFITDGQIEDLEAVKTYCIDLAKDIEAGRRNSIKLVLIGLGDQVDEEQLIQLDDLETGAEVDLWDHRLATEMKDLFEIFRELVDESMILVPGDGIVRDGNNAIVADYRDTGLPAKLNFTLPPGAAQAFGLEVAGNTARQELP